MTNKKIADYLRKKLEAKKFSIWHTDKRCKIPRRIKIEIQELESMINYLEPPKQ